MKIISHRGNLNGSKKILENHPSHIDNVISMGLDVEIDLWYEQSYFFLGHDTPDYLIDLNWILSRAEYLWVHCKTKESLEKIYSHKKINYFWHEEDKYTLTSKGYIWVYPGEKLIPNCICVLPEKNFVEISLENCYAICTDYPMKYKKDLI